jgi:hypothetical protein
MKSPAHETDPFSSGSANPFYCTRIKEQLPVINSLMNIHKKRYMPQAAIDYHHIDGSQERAEHTILPPLKNVNIPTLSNA